MSLILEALNKAEQNQGATTSYNASQAYPTEKRTNQKWMLLLLIAAVGATSAIVTLLIFFKLNPSNGSSQLETHATQNPTATSNISHQQTTQNINIAEPPKEPTNPTTHTRSDSNPQQIALPPGEPGNLIQHREPSLHQLVKNTNHTKKTEFRSNKNRTPSSASRPEETAATRVTTGNNLKIQKREDKPEVNTIGSISNSPFADIKISVHMYSEIPAKRFVYINSTRHGEGSMINNNILLDEITKNGVILNKNGTLYRLPIKL